MLFNIVQNCVFLPELVHICCGFFKMLMLTVFHVLSDADLGFPVMFIFLFFPQLIIPGTLETVHGLWVLPYFIT